MKGSCRRVHAVWAVGIAWILGHTDVLYSSAAPHLLSACTQQFDATSCCSVQGWVAAAPAYLNIFSHGKQQFAASFPAVSRLRLFRVMVLSVACTWVLCCAGVPGGLLAAGAA